MMASHRKSYYLNHPRSAYREFIYWPVKNGWQLFRRGWADSDTWGLDHALAKRLGAQLSYLAEHTHGWPDQKYDTFEDWQKALRENAQALTDYARRPGYSALLTTWHDLQFTGKRDWLDELNAHDDSEETTAAWTALKTTEERWYDEAQKALYWVAEHFGHLWD